MQIELTQFDDEYGRLERKESGQLLMMVPMVEMKNKLDKKKWTGFSNRLDSGDGRERKNSQRINRLF